MSKRFRRRSDGGRACLHAGGQTKVNFPSDDPFILNMNHSFLIMKKHCKVVMNYVFIFY